jgi:hypothetical protein
MYLKMHITIQTSYQSQKLGKQVLIDKCFIIQYKLSNRKYIIPFITGATIGVFLIYSLILGTFGPKFDSEPKFYYLSSLHISNIEESHTKDYTNTTIYFNITDYWKSRDSRPFAPVQKTLLFNFTILNNIDEIQWLNTSANYYNISCFREGELVGQIISIEDSSVGKMGLFLAPNGRHEIISLWSGTINGSNLADGEYEMRIYSNFNGEDFYVRGINFSIEARLTKVRYGTVY